MESVIQWFYYHGGYCPSLKGIHAAEVTDYKGRRNVLLFGGGNIIRFVEERITLRC